MKIEKKIVALCMFALAIGIATILPIAYTPLKASAQVTPFFNPSIYQISVNPEIHSQTILEGGIEGLPYDGATINVIMDYALTSRATDFKDVDAIIEVYKFQFYSEKGSIATFTHSIAITGVIPDTNTNSGGIYAIADWNKEKNTYTFADGTILDITKTVGSVDCSLVYCNDPENKFFAIDGHAIIGDGIFVSEYEEALVPLLADIRNAKTIYVEISRVMSVTYKHSNNSSAQSIITTTLANDEILYNVEIPKIDNDTFSYEPNDRYEPDYSSYPIFYISLSEDMQLYAVIYNDSDFQNAITEPEE
jgi:hypothetical protein